MHDRANAAAFQAPTDNVFARIAGRYDLLCDLFSLGAHRLWKQRMARRIAELGGEVVLDLASGTGAIPVRLLRRKSRLGRLIVTDICPEMLAVARRELAKIGKDGRTIEIEFADAEDLRDFTDASVDTVSMAFAAKICDRRRAVAEAVRVLRPGGVFLCLEAARIPFEPLHQVYLTYMRFCMPLIGRLATGGDASAYQYLLRGVHDFPGQETFAAELAAAGLVEVRYENLSLGIVALHQGRKP